MPKCTAVFCNNKHTKGCGKTFNKFPMSCPDHVKLWVVKMKRDCWYPNKYSVICSDHFTEDCFDRTGQTVRLRDDAVPTVFPNFPKHLQKTKFNRKFSNQRGNLSESQQQPAPNESSTLTEPSSMEDSTSPGLVQLKRKIFELEKKNLNVRKKLKVAQQKVRRLKFKVSNLCDVIDAIKKEQLVTTSTADLLSQSFSGAPLEIMNQIIKKHSGSGKISRDAYPPSLRAFALTLQFYSNKAYNY